MKNVFIERADRRLDTQGEVAGITVSRLLKQEKTRKTNITKSTKALNKIFGFR